MPWLETSASIIGNNQNTIMKTLALMTMALDIPTVIFSAYGMNFKNNSMPLNDLDNAFWVIFFMAASGHPALLSTLSGKNGSNIEPLLFPKLQN